MCKISVVTSVYNCEKYIAETIQSVINQTYTDWEFIIIDDCSKDRSAEIIESFHDKRIKFFRNETNRGQCNNLNFGIKQAKGEYIARLDHDDICYPERFVKQLDYMESNKDVVLCGAWMDILEDGEIRSITCPEICGAKEVGYSLCFADYCTPHSSFMIRKSAMIDNNIWYEKYLYAEDYHLLLQLLKVGSIDYIREALIAYRVFPEQCTQTYSNRLIQNEKDEVRCSYLDSIDFVGTNIIKKAILSHLKTMKDYREFQKNMIQYAEYCELNYNKQEMKKNRCMKQIYHDICLQQKYNSALLLSYLISPFKSVKWLVSGAGIRFAVKCIVYYK